MSQPCDFTCEINDSDFQDHMLSMDAGCTCMEIECLCTLSSMPMEVSAPVDTDWNSSSTTVDNRDFLYLYDQRSDDSGDRSASNLPNIKGSSVYSDADSLSGNCVSCIDDMLSVDSLSNGDDTHSSNGFSGGDDLSRTKDLPHFPDLSRRTVMSSVGANTDLDRSETPVAVKAIAIPCEGQRKKYWDLGIACASKQQEKHLIRMSKNRESAQRSRTVRRDKNITMEKEIAKLTLENALLTSRVAALESVLKCTETV